MWNAILWRRFRDKEFRACGRGPFTPAPFSLWGKGIVWEQGFALLTLITDPESRRQIVCRDREIEVSLL